MENHTTLTKESVLFGRKDYRLTRIAEVMILFNTVWSIYLKSIPEVFEQYPLHKRPEMGSVWTVSLHQGLEGVGVPKGVGSSLHSSPHGLHVYIYIRVW